MSLLGQAFKTDSKCLCHGLEAGWWPEEKPGTVFASFLIQGLGSLLILD